MLRTAPNFLSIIGFFITVILIAGCAAPINLPEGVESQLPDGANRLDVLSDQTVEELYASVQEWLPAHGFVVDNASEVTRIIETAPGEIGQRTRLKLKLRINPYERGSRLEVIGTWTSDVEEATYESAGIGVSGEDEDWFAAVWTGVGRSSFAYAKILDTFHEMPAIEKRYIKQ